MKSFDITEAQLRAPLKPWKIASKLYRVVKGGPSTGLQFCREEFTHWTADKKKCSYFFFSFVVTKNLALPEVAQSAAGGRGCCPCRRQGEGSRTVGLPARKHPRQRGKLHRETARAKLI